MNEIAVSAVLLSSHQTVRHKTNGSSNHYYNHIDFLLSVICAGSVKLSHVYRKEPKVRDAEISLEKNLIKH